MSGWLSHILVFFVGLVAGRFLALRLGSDAPARQSRKALKNLYRESRGFFDELRKDLDKPEFFQVREFAIVESSQITFVSEDLRFVYYEDGGNRDSAALGRIVDAVVLHHRALGVAQHHERGGAAASVFFQLVNRVVAYGYKLPTRLAEFLIPSLQSLQLKAADSSPHAPKKNEHYFSFGQQAAQRLLFARRIRQLERRRRIPRPGCFFHVFLPVVWLIPISPL